MPWSVAPAAEKPPVEGLRVETMTLEDLDGVLEIEVASFPTPWKREHFEEEIVPDERVRIGAPIVRVNEVVRHGGTVVAYVCAWIVFDEFHINNIAVAPDRQGSGIGRWFLRGLLARARAAGCHRAELEVRASNERALALYRREGFVEAGRRANYYQQEGEDAIVMTADLEVR